MEQESNARGLLEADHSQDVITTYIAEVIIDLMRGVVAQNSSDSAFRAAETMDRVTELLASQSDRRPWYSLFLVAIETIKECVPDDSADQRYIDVAEKGTKYLIESFSGSGFAKARRSKSLANFKVSIDDLGAKRR